MFNIKHNFMLFRLRISDLVYRFTQPIKIKRKKKIKYFNNVDRITLAGGLTEEQVRYEIGLSLGHERAREMSTKRMVNWWYEFRYNEN